MHYVLLKAPKKEYSIGQIEIVNNSTPTGKSKVERLCNEGYTPCGFIESELSITQLKYGFRSDADEIIDELRSRERKVIEL